jgi:hypothetical protein
VENTKVSTGQRILNRKQIERHECGTAPMRICYLRADPGELLSFFPTAIALSFQLATINSSILEYFDGV